MNGDAAANSVKMTSLEYWSGDGLYVYFASAFNSQYRVQLELTYV